MVHENIKTISNEYTLLLKSLKTKRDYQEFMDDPKSFMLRHGIEIPENMAVEIVHAVQDTWYFIMPLASDRELMDETNYINAAATRVATRGSFGCVSTIATFSSEIGPGAPSSIASLSTLSTGSSVGTA